MCCGALVYILSNGRYSGKVPPTIPAKRPAGGPVEEGCSRGWARRDLSESEPTPTPTLALVKAQPKNVDQWSGTLIWHRERSDAHLQVLAVDMVRHPYVHSLVVLQSITYVCAATLWYCRHLCELRSLRAEHRHATFKPISSKRGPR